MRVQAQHTPGKFVMLRLVQRIAAGGFKLIAPAMSVETNFHLFSPAHLAILISVPLFAAVLAWITYLLPRVAIWTRFGLSALLIINGLWWCWYRFSALHLHLPQGLPFELCDISLWLTVYVLLRRSQRIYELAYYWGLAGAGMAMLTPDLLAPLLSVSSLNFFVRHGGTVLAILYLLWSSQCRPRAHSWRFAFLALNLYAAAIGLFDFAFGANYLYLRNKPASQSLLDVMGAWPLYIFTADLLALAMFVLMSLPFRDYDIGRSKKLP